MSSQPPNLADAVRGFSTFRENLLQNLLLSLPLNFSWNLSPNLLLSLLLNMAHTVGEFSRFKENTKYLEILHENSD